MNWLAIPLWLMSAFSTPPAATISAAPAIVTNGFNGTVSLAGVSTSWTAGTPGTPTFTVSGTGCSLSNQVISSTTAATLTLTVGTADCIITDPSTSATTTVSNPRAVQTWHINKIGGIRFSANVPTGTCDGTANTAPVGTTPNQHCAFNDMRYMWQDGSTFSYFNIASIMLPGDTMLLHGSIADGVDWRVGFAAPLNYCDPSGFPCFGFSGDPSDSVMPPPPSGSPANHTRILGGNAGVLGGSCTAQTARTQVHGGYAGLSDVMKLNGASYLDVACLDVTDYAACGNSAQNPPCSVSQDFSQYGIQVNNQMDHFTLTDVRMHGLAVAGMLGPTGDGAVLTDVAWNGNAGAGWNADDGTTGNGHLLVQNFEITGNGCVETYPITSDVFPYILCTDQQSDTHGGTEQGYGDGFGTTTTTGTLPWFIDFENGLVRYNTQDGIDALHAQGAGSSTTVNRTLAYGSEGNQLKVGSDGGTFMTNNQIFANCDAMSFPITGFPAAVVFTATATAPTSFTGTVTDGSNTITAVSSTAGLFVGQPVASLSGGLPDFTHFIEGTVITVISGSTITLSRVASNTGSGLTIYGMNNTLTSVTNIGALSVGMPVSNPGSIWPAVITAVNVGANTITIAYGPFAAATGTTISSSFNTMLSLWCRAGDEAIIVSLQDGGRSVVAGNTIYGERFGSTIENFGDLGGIVCSASSCGATSLITYADNILVGFDPLATGTLPAQYFLQSTGPGVPFSTNPFANSGSIYRNNLHYNLGSACPDTGETNTICGIPGVNTVTWPAFGTVNVQPTSGSSNVVGAGVAVSGLTTDFTGATRPNPPSIGAFEFGGAPSAPAVKGSGRMVLKGSAKLVQ